MNRPYRVGLTGSVAAGKSSVGKLFGTWGAVRIDADELAREVVEPGGPALDRIRERWGDEMLAPDGSLDRDAMRRAVFGDEEERRALERIVHAGVRAIRENRRAAAEEASARLIVEEIPLLFETGLEDEFDALVVVDAPPEERSERAAHARGWTPAEFQAVEESQLPVSEKRARADYVIDNGEDRETLAGEARRVWEALVEAAGGEAAGEPGVDARHGSA